MFFYYVRHGQPIYDPDSLTEHGKKQAEALAPRFALYGLDEIYSSTSTRAMQTAEPTCKRLGKEPILCDWAHEGLAWKDLAPLDQNGNKDWLFRNSLYTEKLRSPEVIALGDKWYEHPYFSSLERTGPGMLRIEKAADDFFSSLGFRHIREEKRYVREGRTPPERVALFAHQGFGLTFLSAVLDIPYPLFATTFDLCHSSVTVLHFDEKRDLIYPRVLQLSSDSHLYKEDLMAGYNDSFFI